MGLNINIMIDGSDYLKIVNETAEYFVKIFFIQTLLA